MYKILLHPKVVKFLDKLSQNLRIHIKKKLSNLMENPFHYLEHYAGEDYYKLRIGDYRALIDIDFKKKLIIVRVLDHRKKIYKR